MLIPYASQGEKIACTKERGQFGNLGLANNFVDK
jgi:hypothetical protein